MNRRSFLSGLGACAAAAVVAPAIVEAALQIGGAVVAPSRGTRLFCGSLTGSLQIGDVITIEGVEAFNRAAWKNSGIPRQFVVTRVGKGDVSIYPAAIAADSEERDYATVVSEPKVGARIEIADRANPAQIIQKTKHEALVYPIPLAA
jgi:hypothetical protein